MSMDAAMGMSGAPPTLAAFLGVWVVMMAAMMLPSVAPVSRTYLRVLRTARPRGAAPLRVVGLVAGYLLAWAAYGLVAFVLTHRLDALAATSDRARVWAAAAALAVAGIYQFTPLKATCLRHCRSPLSVLLHVGNFTGPLRDVRVGVWHGGYCLGCCWSLMLVLVAVGVMNMVWMAALTVVIFLEKVWRHRRSRCPCAASSPDRAASRVRTSWTSAADVPSGTRVVMVTRYSIARASACVTER